MRNGLEVLWPDDGPRKTIYSAVQPLLDGTGDIDKPHLERISQTLNLIVGDLTLSATEDELSSQWPACLDRSPRGFRADFGRYGAFCKKQRKIIRPK